MVQTEKKEETLLTIAEVAKLLRVNPTTVRRWIASGSLDAVSLPHLHKRQQYRVKFNTLATLIGK